MVDNLEYQTRKFQKSTKMYRTFTTRKITSKFENEKHIQNSGIKKNIEKLELYLKKCIKKN